MTVSFAHGTCCLTSFAIGTAASIAAVTFNSASAAAVLTEHCDEGEGQDGTN